jgi:hypothetical protein
MGIESHGFKPTHIDLGPAKQETTQTTGVLTDYSPEEITRLENGALNLVNGGWTHNFEHPVFKDMPAPLEAVVRAAALPTATTTDKQAAARALEKRWDELFDAGVDV